MRSSFLVIVGLAGCLMVAASAAAQHQHPTPGPSAEGDPASPAIVLGRLAEVTTQTVRGLEAAVRDRDAGLAQRRADGYVQSMAALVEYVEGGDAAGMASDLRRLDDALERQVKLLHKLAARSPKDLGHVIVTALDSGVRARRVVRAAIKDAGRTKGHPRGERHSTQGRMQSTDCLSDRTA